MGEMAAQTMCSTNVEDMLCLVVVNRMSGCASWDGEVEFGTMLS